MAGLLLLSLEDSPIGNLMFQFLNILFFRYAVIFRGLEARRNDIFCNFADLVLLNEDLLVIQTRYDTIGEKVDFEQSIFTIFSLFVHIQKLTDRIYRLALRRELRSAAKADLFSRPPAFHNCGSIWEKM